MTLLTGGERTWAGGEKEEEKGSVPWNGMDLAVSLEKGDVRGAEIEEKGRTPPWRKRR